MTEEHKNNDPEKLIFRTALNSIQIEPSEKFWNSALHGIINKEGVLRKKQVKTWRLVSFGLVAVIGAFCIHDVLVYDKMDKIEQQVTELKNVQKQILEKENNTLTQSEHNKSNNAAQSNTLAVLPATDKEGQTVPHTITEGNSQQPSEHHFAASAPHKNTGHVMNSNSSVLPQTIAANNNTSAPTNSEQPAMHENNTTTAVNTENQPILQVSKASNTGSQDTATNNTAGNVNAISGDSATTLAKADSANSINSLGPIEQPKPKFSFAHKLSVAAFFAPGTLNSQLRDNDNNDDVSTHDVSYREGNWFEWQAGFKVGFDISPKIALKTGLYYNASSCSIKQTIVTARQGDDGGVGYSVVTSSGVVNIPYTGAAPQVGDSITVHGSSTRGFICIPLQLSYLFATHNKFGFFVDIAAVASIATYAGTTLSWENTSLQEGEVSVSSIQGLQKLHFGYSIGAGAMYTLGRNISVYTEPLLQGVVTSITKNTPISSYPLFIGCSAGLTFHF